MRFASFSRGRARRSFPERLQHKLPGSDRVIRAVAGVSRQLPRRRAHARFAAAGHETQAAAVGLEQPDGPEFDARELRRQIVQQVGAGPAVRLLSRRAPAARDSTRAAVRRDAALPRRAPRRLRVRSSASNAAASDGCTMPQRGDARRRRSAGARRQGDDEGGAHRPRRRWRLCATSVTPPRVLAERRRGAPAAARDAARGWRRPPLPPARGRRPPPRPAFGLAPHERAAVAAGKLQRGVEQIWGWRFGLRSGGVDQSKAGTVGRHAATPLCHVPECLMRPVPARWEPVPRFLRRSGRMYIVHSIATGARQRRLPSLAAQRRACGLAPRAGF